MPLAKGSSRLSSSAWEPAVVPHPSGSRARQRQSRPASHLCASGRWATLGSSRTNSSTAGLLRISSRRQSNGGHRCRKLRSSTRAQLGDSLEEFLLDATNDPKMRQVMMSMSEAIRTIAYKVKTASCSGTSCINTFGDEQLEVDMVADKLMFEALRYSNVVRLACSDEVPEPIDLGGDGFSVAFDPLVGSTVVDSNFAVGTVFGVWPGNELLGVHGYEQVAAGLGIYGPRTVFCLAIAGFPGAHEFLLQDDGKWLHVKETLQLEEGKLFAPGNLRASADNPKYRELIDYYLNEQYTLRYTGGMASDIFQIMVKEKGVFTTVSSPSCPTKLRLMFEVAPLSFLVECAGGMSSGNGRPESVLVTVVDDFEQTAEVCLGSPEEVRRFEMVMYGRAPRFEPLANYDDPVERFCNDAPGADECRMYE